MSIWMTTTVALVIGFAVVLHISRQLLSSQTSRPLPPGPPGLPWVGNVTGIDTDALWRTCNKWAKTYGDIVYARLMGKDVIIINSVKVAKDLLEVRSTNYSDRPYFNTYELCGLGFNSVLMRYGDRWRLHRQIFHRTFRSDAVPRFLPLIHRKTCDFLCRLISSPEDLEGHVFEYTTSLILNNTYDYNPTSRKDEFVNNVANMMHVVVPAVRPDISLVADAFPFLLRLPSWLPGMSFKRNMEIARIYAKRYLDESFDYVLQRLKESGTNVEPSMVYDALRGMEEKRITPKESWMEELKGACGTVLAAGSETSNSVLMAFFLMMVLNPGVQKKAQEQIDTVVGRKRLPTMDDRPMLPLLDAIFCETLRSHPAIPLSMPRAVVDDDVYGGFHIPKGAIVLPNLWSMTHDESTYPNPDAFIPERFLNEDGSLKPNDIKDIVFGFGRRICVGRHYADASIWNIIAGVLAVFDILKPLDDNGIEMTPEGIFSSGIAARPLPFKCRIIPRCSDMDVVRLKQWIGSV